MALPPGYSSAIWPAAGIAIACCLRWQASLVWPGIFIGSAITNATIDGGLNLGLLPAVIALGSSIQAILAAKAMRQMDPEVTLDSPRLVVRSCLSLVPTTAVASIIGNTALLQVGAIGAEDLLNSSLTWWVGDLLGAIIFIPLSLLILDSRPIWRGRRLQSGIPILVAFFTCVAIYYYANGRENRFLVDKFHTQARQAITLVNNLHDRRLQQLTALAGLFDASDLVTREEFERFNRRNAELFSEPYALSWAPLIDQNKIGTYPPDLLVSWGYPSQIHRPANWSANPGGLLVPITYISPREKNLLALGLDLNSEPTRAAAIAKVMSSHKFAMTAKLSLAQDDQGPGATILMAPVFSTAGELESIVTSVLDLRELQAIFEHFKDLQWQLEDQQDSERTVLYSSTQAQMANFSGQEYQDKTGLYYKVELGLADREWILTLFQPYGTLVPKQVNISLIILLLAFGVCGVTGGVTLVISGEHQRINAKVIEKTRELSAEIAKNQAIHRNLVENEQKYRTLFDEAPVGHGLSDLASGQFVAINHKFTEITGFNLADITGQEYFPLSPAGYLQDNPKLKEALLYDGRHAPHVVSFHHKSGEAITLRLYGSLVTDPFGKTLLLSVIEDITEQENTANRLKLLAQVFQLSGEGIVITDKDNHIIEVNDAFAEITGYGLDEVKGQDPKVLSSGNTAKKIYADMWQALQTQGFWQGEIWDRHKDGHEFLKCLSISVVRNENEQITHYIGSFTDITARKASEQKIHFLAHHDSLTLLPNRWALLNQLNQCFASAREEQSQIAVLFIDMDHFKNINDTLGHHIGDEMLIEVAKRLKAVVRQQDIVARLGGDEFVVILTHISTETAAIKAEEFKRVLSRPYRLNQLELHSSPSIGISQFPQDGNSVEELMKNADMAMYRAKAAGRNNFQFFTAAMNEIVTERQQLEAALRQALNREELLLHYQPQIDITTGEVVAVEALIRWQHPELGMIPPLKFIPIAEEINMIVPIGIWVLDTALAQLRQWRNLGFNELRMAVNLSAHQLRDGNIADDVFRLLAKHRLPANALELEITESVAMLDPERNAKLMGKLREQGVEIAIDDFGTGYSSLSYLKLLPLDRLKLDRSFVKDIESDVNDSAICAATISMSHELSLSVIAEGVENEAQLVLLSKLGCDVVQGYYFSKPLPAQECVRFIGHNLGIEATQA